MRVCVASAGSTGLSTRGSRPPAMLRGPKPTPAVQKPPSERTAAIVVEPRRAGAVLLQRCHHPIAQLRHADIPYHRSDARYVRIVAVSGRRVCPRNAMNPVGNRLDARRPAADDPFITRSSADYL